MLFAIILKEDDINVMGTLIEASDYEEASKKVEAKLFEHGEMLDVFVDSPDYAEAKVCIKNCISLGSVITGTLIDTRQDEEKVFNYEIDIIQVR